MQTQELHVNTLSFLYYSSLFTFTDRWSLRFNYNYKHIEYTYYVELNWCLKKRGMTVQSK